MMRVGAWLFIHWLLILAGCGMLGRSSVKPPSVNPKRAASEAISLYDKNKDGSLDVEELAASPGLLSAFDKYDSSGDKRLDEQEMAARLIDMYSSASGLTTLNCVVTFDGRPLGNANVRFVPEEFLGDYIKPATGVTDSNGTAAIGIADEELPDKARGLKVMQFGLYRVEITHPSLKIPARYNTQTTLGHELHWSNSDEPVVFRLRSK